MAIHSDQAVVLRKRDIRETSLLIVLYTREFGKIRGLMKGVRGPRGPMGNQIQLFTHNDVVFYDSKRTGTHTVSQCDLIDFFEDVREDIVKTGYACYFIELVDSLTEEKDPSVELFELLLQSLRLLKSDASVKRISRIFEIKLLNLSGVMPRLDSCALCGTKIDFRKDSFDTIRFSYKAGGLICGICRAQDTSSCRILPGTAHFIDDVARAGYDKVPRLKVSRDIGLELEGIMKKFIGYQLDVRIKSLEFLEKIQSA